MPQYIIHYEISYNFNFTIKYTLIKILNFKYILKKMKEIKNIYMDFC